MPRKPVRRKDRAVSPVIATIIIVAVAIVMSIAVAYWVLGLAGTFTRYEKIEIMSMYASTSIIKNASQLSQELWRGWNVTAMLRNTGSATATINLILINGKPLDTLSNTYINMTYDRVNNTVKGLKSSATLPLTIDPGGQYLITIHIPRDGFKPGMSIEVTFHTAAGSDYPKVVVLP